MPPKTRQMCLENALQGPKAQEELPCPVERGAAVNSLKCLGLLARTLLRCCHQIPVLLAETNSFCYSVL